MFLLNVRALSVLIGLCSMTELKANWSVSPLAINFGTQTAGIPPRVGTLVTINNTGNGTVTLSNVTVTPPFILRTGVVPNAIPAHGYTSPQLGFAFTPDAPGSYSGNAVISFNDGTSATISLTGVAVAATAAITATPTSLTFSAQNQGTVSPSQSVTLTNTGTASVAILGFGTVPSTFAQSPAAAKTIGPGASLRVPVTFTPNAAGAIRGNLNIQFDVVPSIGISLLGTGVAPSSVGITSPPALPAATVNATYQAFPVASGGTPPYTWSLQSGVLPSGLTISPDGVVSGVISKTGTFSFTIRVTDSNARSATQKVMITASNPIPANCNTIAYDIAGSNTPLVPLTDLGTGTYLGAIGGLYPGGSNDRPDAHTAAGVSLAQAIAP